MIPRSIKLVLKGRVVGLCVEEEECRSACTTTKRCRDVEKQSSLYNPEVDAVGAVSLLNIFLVWEG